MQRRPDNQWQLPGDNGPPGTPLPAKLARRETLVYDPTGEGVVTLPDSGRLAVSVSPALATILEEAKKIFLRWMDNLLEKHPELGDRNVQIHIDSSQFPQVSVITFVGRALGDELETLQAQKALVLDSEGLTAIATRLFRSAISVVLTQKREGGKPIITGDHPVLGRVVQRIDEEQMAS